MAKITKEAALLYHSQGKPGKIEVVPTKPYSTQTDLSLAYSPGVAEPCLEIEKNTQDAYFPASLHGWKMKIIFPKVPCEEYIR